MTEVLIASSSIDRPNYWPVSERLVELGHAPIIYNADKVADGSDSLSISIKNEAVSVIYEGKQLNPSTISAAWYRHPQLFGYDYEDKAMVLCIEDEANKLQQFIWDQIPENRWLNEPKRMEAARGKLSQLTLANTLGFDTPTTIVTNKWDEALELLDDEFIVKMSKGLLYEQNKPKGAYTTRLSKQSLSAQLLDTSPFPAIFQDYKSKKREWRITLVGDRAFSAAIYTSDSAKDDWRKHQLTPDVEFKNEQFSVELTEKCYQFLGKLGLKYGCFDFIETVEGATVFLEMNPNGQYMWLEKSLDMPISNSIAAELSQTAKLNK